MAWEYTRRADMVNRGFSGYTSRQILQIADGLTAPAEAARVKLAVVWLGANDAKLRT
jgi:lysophospholipase L1-like esterase